MTDPKTAPDHQFSSIDDIPADSPDPLIRQMRAIALKSREQNRQATVESDDGPLEKPSPSTTDVMPVNTQQIARSLKKRVSDIEQQLMKQEEAGFFDSHPIQPKNEFPTLLARLPIFRPTRRRRQQTLQDIDNALVFTTPFGKGRRLGPPLTVRDEDTLIALMRLRSRRLSGQPKYLPGTVPDIYQSNKGRVSVHFVVCCIDQINDELGLTGGGSNSRATLDSVRRLAATSLELELVKHDRYLNTMKERGKLFHLLHLDWEMYKDQGMVIVTFPPIVAQWLEKEYTYIDWKMRRTLTDLGKVVHRFLSSQPGRYSGELLKIAETVGYDGPSKNIKPRFSAALDELVQCGWLTSYTIEGNGRKQPLRLTIERL